MPLNISGSIVNSGIAKTLNYKSVVTRGLTLHAEASAPESYPETGTTWFNLPTSASNGTLTNGPTFDSSTVNGTLVFDGTNDYVTFGNFGSFYTNGTICFWVLASSISSYPNPFTTNYVGSNVGIRFELANTGNFGCVIGNDAGTYAGYTLTTSMSANIWYHASVVWNTSTNTAIGYWDGTQAFSTSHSYWASTIPNLVIGNGFSADRYWYGKIANVMMYNRSLSESEISQNYNAQKSRFGY